MCFQTRDARLLTPCICNLLVQVPGTNQTVACLPYLQMTSKTADGEELRDSQTLIPGDAHISSSSHSSPDSRERTPSVLSPWLLLNGTEPWHRTGMTAWDPYQEAGHGLPSHSGSYGCCALCLAKEQMFNNFAAARKRLHNVAELFLDFGKC